MGDVTHNINVYFQLIKPWINHKVNKSPPCKGSTKNDSVSFLDMVFATGTGAWSMDQTQPPVSHTAESQYDFQNPEF